jgi:hypothetical protein
MWRVRHLGCRQYSHKRYQWPRPFARPVGAGHKPHPSQSRSCNIVDHCTGWIRDQQNYVEPSRTLVIAGRAVIAPRPPCRALIATRNTRKLRETGSRARHTEHTWQRHGACRSFTPEVVPETKHDTRTLSTCAAVPSAQLQPTFRLGRGIRCFPAFPCRQHRVRTL